MGLLLTFYFMKDWFKLKKYPHIGFPLESKERYVWIEKYVTDKQKIKEHSFLPFIHRATKRRRFRKKYETKYGKQLIYPHSQFIYERYKDVKTREIYYSSHLDSLIYSYYAIILNEHYEEKLLQFEISEVVTAYRSIKINPEKDKGPNKCNIEFADEVFNFIREVQDEEFSVIAFDISSFFDNLDHAILRSLWAEVLNVDKLPDDHFNVYKSITRFCYVEIVDLFEEFKDKIYTCARGKNGKYLETKQKKISAIKYLKSQNAIAFCKEKEFFQVKKKLIKQHKVISNDLGQKIKRNFGVPQGSPISSVLANIYLLHFDKKIADAVKNIGLYRRYSDDMIVICPKSKKDEILKLVYSEIEKYKLAIQPKKTQIFTFKRFDGKLVCGQEFEKETNWNKNFIYLGFEFDGESTLIKSASISNYYRKMKRNIRRAKYYAKISKNKGIFKRRLYKKFTYKGSKRYKKYKWNIVTNKFEKTDDLNWGNFHSYVRKANKIMTNNKIGNQLNNHWRIFHKELNN